MKKRISKKRVHKYVVWWFDDNSTTNINDWEKDVFLEIANDYIINELEMCDFDSEKLFSTIKNDPLYVKKYKQWFEQNALKRIQTDF